MRAGSQDLFLSLCLGYCLTWELADAHAPEHWELLRAALRDSGELTERARWTAELYEEGLPSAQEERAILSRLERVLKGRRQMESVKARIVAMLPEAMRSAAAGHSLLRALKLPQEPSVVQTWLKRSGLRLPVGEDTPQPWGSGVGEREADFGRFLSLPRFEDNFRSYWHTKPKDRGNRETRALVTIGAIVGQSVRSRETAERERWMGRLGNTCHYSSQTQEDVLTIATDTRDSDYEAAELTYRLLADANPRDVTYIKDFLAQYAAEMTPFAAEIKRLMAL